MNSVNFVGRWTKDHEVYEGNTTVVKNTLAVDHPFKKDSASFPRIVMFGKTGELANQYTGKGSQVAISGYLETGSYEKSDGTKVFTTDIVANSIKFLDSKGSGQQSEKTENNYPQSSAVPAEVSDSDLPF